jgi:hypothetical protein
MLASALLSPSLGIHSDKVSSKQREQHVMLANLCGQKHPKKFCSFPKINVNNFVSIPCILIFFVGLGFEIRALHLLGRCFNVWAMPLAPCILIFFVVPLFYLFYCFIIHFCIHALVISPPLPPPPPLSPTPPPPSPSHPINTQ